jgi:Leu/Phe-tRNA-protein transferase
MITAKPYIKFVSDSGYGESTFTRQFDDATSALAYLSGYLGQHPCSIKDFQVEWEWEYS